MMIKTQERIICCVVAVILFILGIGVELATTDSSFLCTLNPMSTAEAVYALDASGEAQLYAVHQTIQEAPVCTLSMLGKGMESFRCVRMTQTITLLVGLFLQGLLGRLKQEDSYQSAESREDGQLFLCRAVIVNYIHKKDSGE